MEFYFPPKEKSPSLLKAEENLMGKGYALSKDKKMCQYLQDKQCLNENQGFIFEVKKGDKAFNQKSYEEIGEILTDYVYGLMESDPMNLTRIEIPNNKGMTFLDNCTVPSTLCVTFECQMHTGHKVVVKEPINLAKSGIMLRSIAISLVAH